MGVGWRVGAAGKEMNSGFYCRCKVNFKNSAFEVVSEGAGADKADSSGERRNETSRPRVSTNKAGTRFQMKAI